jgi:Ser/Thr protein kinase RdoA (MazF antagonist)
MAPDPTRVVLSRYPPAVADLDWTPLGSGGGFSGAAVWRGDLAGRPAFALKAWPVGYPADRLAAVHRWMREAERTGLVPAVVPTREGGSWVEHAGRVWDVTGWMPGAADFHRDPSDAKLVAACTALAVLHRCWAPAAPTLAPCPGVQRRLALLNGFITVGPPSLDPTYEEALGLLRSHVPAAIDALRPWADRPVPVFPCLCDVWHDHVYFDGGRVTGFIDFGAMKTDHPAVDLARMLGDLVNGDPDRMRLGLNAYRAAGGPVAIDPRFVSTLDRTGVVCAVIFWLNRLDSAPADNPQIAGRVTRVIGRMARF